MRSFRTEAVAACAALALTGCGSGERRTARSGSEPFGTAPPSEQTTSTTGASAIPPHPDGPRGGERPEIRRTLAATPADAGAAPSAPSPTARGDCPLTCVDTNRGRVAAAEEARLGGALGEITRAIRQCSRETPALTLRFDSQGTLTHLGVDAEETDAQACSDALAQRRPTITYAGPSTLRCRERCGS